MDTTTWPRQPPAPAAVPSIVRTRYLDVIRPLLRRLEHGLPRGPDVAPGPEPSGLRWLVGGSSRRDQLGEILRNADRYGDVVRTALGTRSRHMVFHLLRHPSHVEHVLADNRANYRKSFSYQVLGGVMGEGLLTSEGDLWLTHRRMLQALFRREQLAAFVPAMAGCVERLLARWDTYEPGRRIDVASEMGDLTLDIVGRTLFSADLSTDARELGESLSYLLRVFDDRIESGVGALSLVFVDFPAPGNRRILAALDVLDKIVYRLIAQRRDRDERADMLSMLLVARDEETGVRLSDEQVRDHIMTFMLAGHETTANALAWTWYLLSKHPDVARRVREEASGVRLPDDLEALVYTQAVVSESMRLYPPAWIVERDVIADDTIGGFRIPAGSVVNLSPYVTHRHPGFWPNPQGFDPERFLSGAKRPRFAYFPFGGGPRQCIGMSFAMQEAVLALAMIARRYRVDLVPGHPVVPLPSVTLRPRYGLQVTVHR